MDTRTADLARLYETEHTRLRSIVRRLIGNPNVAEDVVQQAFANILARTDETAANFAYVRQAVRNLALNHLRDTRRRGEAELTGFELDTIADERPSPEMAALYRSELRRLLQAVAELPPRRREAFTLNKVEGLSYDEIAERMGISRNTVISQIVSAMLALDRALALEP
ncbi:DNA-directed RNA polymerase sigma-70 factor [Brucella endophytica]|uniref:DNA-directed RNA polymerase sigma-70 factor n=1 Tax=Brucella endophytica TaxID=1963359 RepID=A0A916SLR0_9HYPH|nr:sigma-70 family RNA polymerase sigma factor [Brucella endophytica]GGB05618.1 DNA-directed RNA polymerase sigma-70 factor [Brucella endophytica]